MSDDESKEGKSTALKRAGYNNYTMTDTYLVKEIGVDLAFFFGIICSKYNYWEKHRLLKDGNRFYMASQAIEEEFGITPQAQKTRFDGLEYIGLIETSFNSRERKKYVKINLDALKKMLDELKKIKKERDEEYKRNKNKDNDE